MIVKFRDLRELRTNKKCSQFTYDFDDTTIISYPEGGGYLIFAVDDPKFVKFPRVALAGLMQRSIKIRMH